MTDANRSVAANATTANVLAGKSLEFVMADAVINFYCVAAAVGIFLTVTVGNELLVDDQEVSPANRYPTMDADLIARVGGSAGDRILARYRNSTAGAIVVNGLMVEVLTL